MKIFLPLIHTIPLFKGIGKGELEAMMNCLHAGVQSFHKEEILLLTGNPVQTVGLVLEGTVHVLREDKDGRQNILTEVPPFQMFGEVFACAGISHSPVTVKAATNCTILFIDYRRMITTCSASCAFHNRLIENMLSLLATKNLVLNQKNQILSKRTIRQRLQCFFDIQRGDSGSFTIPYNREELAAYLCVDRSALSSELSKMQEEGLITVNKNRFEVLY